MTSYEMFSINVYLFRYSLGRSCIKALGNSIKQGLIHIKDISRFLPYCEHVIQSRLDPQWWGFGRYPPAQREPLTDFWCKPFKWDRWAISFYIRLDTPIAGPKSGLHCAINHFAYEILALSKFYFCLKWKIPLKRSETSKWKRNKRTRIVRG